ncbi:uncharacterized protein LTR77_001176 [Saxophila tyrrhenica]|uniref:Uncharacterized protein n=1 Tax=Saxophila tyrrhenica TaxID=1690608 RepID=A0AAV9PMJ7_9PEZI|nr:hypothetical protein LTR77_001176 [Saxophila tyrrhenica]
MAEAIYYHASLYAFDAAARDAIIATFKSRVNDVSVRCHYDTEQGMFCVVCPSGQDVGPEADNILATVIDEFVLQEVSAAEREQRESSVRMFQELDYDAPITTGQQQHTAPTTQNAPAAPSPKVVHVMANYTTRNSSVKFFLLREMPQGVLERLLAPSDVRSTKAVKSSMAIRLVKWDAERAVHVFNARLGTPIEPAGNSTLHILNSALFERIEDQRANIRSSDNDNTQIDTMQRWRFVGQEPSVQQFLAGMGETELVDPEEPPEVPADGENFMARPGFGITALQGRARVPRARAHSSSETSAAGNTNDADDDSTVTDRQPFSNLFSSRAQASGSGHHAETDTRNAISDVTESRPDFASLFQRSGIPTAASLAGVFSSITAQNGSTSLDAALTDLNDESTSSPSRHVEGPTPSDYHGMPPYSRTYATTDDIGLVAPAVNQAAWETENNVPHRRRVNRSGVQRRMQPSTTNSVPVSTAISETSGSDPQNSGSPGPRLDAGRRLGNSHARLSAQAPPASTHLAQPQHCPFDPHNNLIDDRAPINAPTTAPRPPPGFLDNEQQSRGAPTMHDGDHNSASFDAGPNLMDEDDDDQVVERLQPALAPARTFNTMRQQKGKKKGATTGNNTAMAKASSSPPVELPKPEPPPAPKSRKSKDKHKENTTNTTAETADASNGGLEDELSALVQQLSTSSDLSLARIDVRFGMVLIRHVNDRAFFTGAMETAEVEKKLHEAGDAVRTDFLARLTTSTTDARYLLDSFSGGEVAANVVYEVHLKNSEGRIRVLRVDQAAQQDFHVLATETALGTAYLHYPIHVWDAEVTVDMPTVEESLTEPCRTIVSSMRTLGQAPSFTAMIPLESGSVEKVMAKRVFTKTGGDGVVLKVTEVQDLIWAPTLSPDYNLQATAGTSEEMIEGQRLWWEAGLVLDDVGPQATAKLHGVIDEVVSKIDGVGYSNVGPWQRGPEPEPEPRRERSIW